MTATAGEPAAAAEGAVSFGIVFADRRVACVPDVTLTISGFIAVEVIEGLSTVFRERAMVAIVWIEPVVNVAVEAAGTMEPRSGTDKESTVEPVRAVISVGRAVIRSVIEVTVRACRRGTNANTH